MQDALRSTACLCDKGQRQRHDSGSCAGSRLATCLPAVAAMAPSTKKSPAAGKDVKTSADKKSDAPRDKTSKEKKDERLGAYVSGQLFQLAAGRHVVSGAWKRTKR